MSMNLRDNPYGHPSAKELTFESFPIDPKFVELSDKLLEESAKDPELLKALACPNIRFKQTSPFDKIKNKFARLSEKLKRPAIKKKTDAREGF